MSNEQAELERFTREKYRAMSDEQREAWIAAWARMTPNPTSAKLDAYFGTWEFQARNEQLLPPNVMANGQEWVYWLYLAGRGAGKTRTGGETVRTWIKQGFDRIGLIAPTAGDARDVMVEGESGLLACCRHDDYTHDGRFIGRPVYEPSKRRLTWDNGAMATLYSADEPERLRGPQHEKLWTDELAAWRYMETWDLAMFGLRLGIRPQVFISTTPKPKKLILDLLKDKSTIITRGSTYSNRVNLSPTFFAQVVTKYEGTRLGKQELDGELLEEAENALWSRKMLDDTRKAPADIDRDGFWFLRIVVAVDPATSANPESDETGIIVAGVGNDNHGYVLADYTARRTPAEWAKVARKAFLEWGADRIVAEGNQGGLMVELTLRSASPEGEVLPIRLVHASRGKQARAEPISAMFEQSRCHIVGKEMRDLEDQLCVWEPLSGAPSPDRLDAMVWALTDCFPSTAQSGHGEIVGLTA